LSEERTSAKRGAAEHATGVDSTGSLAEAQLRALTDDSPDALIILDGRKRIAMTNGRLLELFGYEREEIVEQGAWFHERVVAPVQKLAGDRAQP
jgi:PAS domain-containing protein